MDENESLSTIRKEDTLKSNCEKFGIEYHGPSVNETNEQQIKRRNDLRLSIDRERKKIRTAQLSLEQRDEVKKANTKTQQKRRANLSQEQRDEARNANTATQQKRRANLSPRQHEEERRVHTAAERNRRANLSQEQRDEARNANTATQQKCRANLSPQQHEEERRVHTAAERNRRANLSQEQRDEARNANTATQQKRRANLSPEQRDEARRANTVSRQRLRAQLSSEQCNEIRAKDRVAKQRVAQRNGDIDDDTDVNDDANHFLKPPSESLKEELINKATTQVTRTRREDGTHKANVCVVCDRLIIGTKEVKKISKERLESNKERISVESYESFYEEDLNELLIKQYEVEGLEGLLLSPRAYRDGDNFECCKSCCTSMMPSNAKKSTGKPPKHAIANGFVIGHMPRILHIPGEEEPRRTGFDLDSDEYKQKCHDVFRVSLSVQRMYGYIFAYMAGAQKSVMGNITFYEMDQTHMGATIHQYRSTGANNHLLCVLSGRFTPDQRTIARNKALINTSLYVDVISWFIRASGHWAYRDLPLPNEAPEVIILEDDETQHSIPFWIRWSYSKTTY